MPSHTVHRKVDKIFFGKSYPEVHRVLDWPIKIVGAHEHRRFFHRPSEAAILSYMVCGDVMPGLFHVVLDRIDSRLRRMQRRHVLLAARRTKKKSKVVY